MANILIADDSIIMRKNLKSIITRAGHNVVSEAVNGQQAVLLYNKSDVDLVTLDITMPVMDGIEALKKILKKDPEAKVIIISALDQKKMVFQALECGAKYYVIKPVTEEKIVNALENVLNIQQRSTSQEEFPQNLEHNQISSTSPQRHTSNLEDQIERLPPFTIDNVSGTFIVNINKTMDGQNVSTLDSAMRGFLFIKPLKITFNLCNDLLQKDVYNALTQMARLIKSAGGEIEIKGDSHANNFFDIK